MKNNQLLEELLNLSNQINQAIYEAAGDDYGYSVKNPVSPLRNVKPNRNPSTIDDPYGIKPATSPAMTPQMKKDLAKDIRQRNYEGSAKSYVDDIKRKAGELSTRVANSSTAKKAVDLAGKVEDKAFATAADINKRGLGDWAKNRVEVRGGQVADLAKAAYNDPKGYVAANKGALGAAAGVAALGAGVYAAKKMAQHKRWIKNGCDSITSASEKIKCKNYVASKKG